MKKAILCALFAALCIFILSTNNKSNASQANPPANDNSARVILPQAMEEKAIKEENIKAIELYDIDGKLVGTLGSGEVKGVVDAYNKSTIDDTSYIDMIAGKSMGIIFKDGTKINIHSYGSQTNVVASGEKVSYHLVCPEIAKILLESK